MDFFAHLVFILDLQPFEEVFVQLSRFEPFDIFDGNLDIYFFAAIIFSEIGFWDIDAGLLSVSGLGTDE